MDGWMRASMDEAAAPHFGVQWSRILLELLNLEHKAPFTHYLW